MDSFSRRRLFLVSTMLRLLFVYLCIYWKAVEKKVGGWRSNGSLGGDDSSCRNCAGSGLLVLLWSLQKILFGRHDTPQGTFLIINSRAVCCLIMWLEGRTAQGEESMRKMGRETADNRGTDCWKKCLLPEMELKWEMLALSLHMNRGGWCNTQGERDPCPR